MTRPPVVAFLWDHFSAYHMDRCEALGAALAGRAQVIGLEVASTSLTYAWGESPAGSGFAKVTLFPGQAADDVGGVARLRAIRREVRRQRITHLFVSGYERADSFALALLLRLTGSKVYVNLDSKFDDKPRRLALELLKRLLMLPYHGGFAAGRRSAEYLRFLGLRQRPVATGYDTVSLARLRAHAADGPHAPWEERPFLAVARFVPKKNLALALEAYAAFRARCPQSPRRLRLCGGGVLEADLRAQAEAQGIADHVDLLAFVPQEEIAREMADALCLLLPSHEEQWGLVVNEALAFGLPVLASTNVGALDSLVTPMVNGLALDPRDAAGWAEAMVLLAGNEALWQRMAEASLRRAPEGDVARFVEGVQALTGLGIRP